MIEAIALGVAGLAGLACAGVLALVLAFLAWRWWNAPPHDARYYADRSNRSRRWAQAVMAIYQGDAGDPGYWDAEDAEGVLTNGWSTPDRAELDALLGRYERGEVNVAFDKARIVWLARLGAGAGWLTQDESWTHVARARGALQAELGGWRELGDQIRDGVFAWYGGKEKMPADNREQLERAMAWGLEDSADVPWR